MPPAPPAASHASRLTGLMQGLKACLNKCCGESGLSRDQIVDRLNGIAEAAGVKLTAGNSKGLSLATLEKWLNPQNTDHPPSLVAVNALVLALGDHRPLAHLLEIHGLQIMEEQDRFALEYGTACLAAREAAQKIKKMEAQL